MCYNLNGENVKNSKKEYKDEIINIYVDDIDTLYNQFDGNDISDELASYIENRCSRSVKNKVVIKVRSKDELNGKQKDDLVDAIRSHFGQEVKYLSRDTSKMNFINLIYFIFGIAIIVLYYLIPFSNIAGEIIEILGWFVIWESAFNLFFTDNEMDKKIDYAKKIIDAKVIFEKRG